MVLPLDAMLVKQHFVQPDQLYLMAIAKTTVETMQHALSLLPIQVQALLPDFLLVPEPEENQSQLLAFSGRLLVRESGYSGGSIDDLNLYLTVCDNSMSLGLFKNDGSFDQNRILISKAETNFISSTSDC